MTTTAASRADQTMKGIAIMVASYAVFALSDATVKWLVADFAVLQVLFTRSLLVCLLTAAVGGRRNLAALAASPNKGWLVVTGIAVFAAFLCYFTAARSLGLAQLVTIYFAAPVIVVTLCAFVLGEAVGPSRWIAVLVGFAGAAVAASPQAGMSVVPAGFAAASAFFWAVSQLLIRKVSLAESAFNQTFVSNAVFTVAAGVALPWVWRTPDPWSLGLMLFLGLAGGVAQFLLYEGFRYASASVLAPIEYTGLIWAFSLGYLIWHDVPRPNVLLGAALIVLGSVGLILSERKRSARPRALPNPCESGPEAGDD